MSPGGSGYFICIQNMKLVTTRFKSGGLHEKHVVATWNLGNHLKSIECAPRFSLNFVGFIWNNPGVFRFKMYAIVAVPFDKPKILHLYHRAASEGWATNFLSDYCFDEFKLSRPPWAQLKGRS